MSLSKDHACYSQVKAAPLGNNTYQSDLAASAHSANSDITYHSFSSQGYPQYHNERFTGVPSPGLTTDSACINPQVLQASPSANHPHELFCCSFNIGNLDHPGQESLFHQQSNQTTNLPAKVAISGNQNTSSSSSRFRPPYSQHYMSQNHQNTRSYGEQQPRSLEISASPHQGTVATLPVAAEKRTYDALSSGNLELSSSSPRSTKMTRVGIESVERDASYSPYDTDPPEPPKRIAKQSLSHASPQKTRTTGLTNNQRKVIRQWYKIFGTEQPQRLPAVETTNALATVVQTSPQVVREYLTRKYSESNTTPVPAEFQAPTTPQTPIYPQDKATRTSYTVKTANPHLPTQALTLVEKYVHACQRRRPQSDGRRSVNEGPYRCTFNCGYRTKRAFDWRRHEETHEPQELWLCHLCCQNREVNPFLVNRKDKFLKHAKDGHKEWDPEKVLEMSSLNFRPHFDERCPFCPGQVGNWDERCKHILGHFEDGMERGLRKDSMQSKRSEREASASDEDEHEL